MVERELATPVRLTIALPSHAAQARSSWRFLLDMAILFEDCGFDRIIVSDHVVFGEHLDAYARPELGGSAGGVQPTGPDGHWLEPLTVLTAAAAVTDRIRLGTNVLLAALRRPVVLAKTAATLDALSGGRLDLGVGVGWQREEYEAAGLDFDRRGRLLDHTLDVCTTFWTRTVASHSSPELAFERIHMMPKPMQEGGVPVWVSGTANRRVATRLSRYGRGWIPWGPDRDDLESGWARMRELLVEAGEEPERFGVQGLFHVPPAEEDTVDLGAARAALSRFAAGPATDLVVRGLPVADDLDRARDELSAFVAMCRSELE